MKKVLVDVAEGAKSETLLYFVGYDANLPFYSSGLRADNLQETAALVSSIIDKAQPDNIVVDIRAGGQVVYEHLTRDHPCVIGVCCNVLKYL